MINVTDIAAQLMAILAILVFATTIIVGVLKTFIKIPTNYLAIIVSLIITLIAFFAYMSYTGTTILWYYVVGAIIAGIFVAYISMYGFDKFKEAWDSAHSYKYKK